MKDTIIEEIHKRRSENYEKTKNMNSQELIEYTNKKAAIIEKKLTDLKKESAPTKVA